MTFDPATWRESIRVAILGGLMVCLVLVFAAAPRSPIATVATAVIPAVIGGLIWRFDRLPWADILSWTVPLGLWTAVALAVLPRLGPPGWIAGGLSVAAWFSAFIFWTSVTKWWYRVVLRKPYPGSAGGSAPT